MSPDGEGPKVFFISEFVSRVEPGLRIVPADGEAFRGFDMPGLMCIIALIF
jgi:hypothetical protein